MENIIVDNTTYKPSTVYEELIENANASALQKKVNLLMAAWMDVAGDFSYEMSELKYGIKIKTGSDATNYISYGTFKSTEDISRCYLPTAILNLTTENFESIPVPANRPAFTWIFKDNLFLLQYSDKSLIKFVVLAKDITDSPLILGINNINGIIIKSDIAYNNVNMSAAKQISKDRICLIPYYDIEGGRIDGLYECVADDRSSAGDSQIYKDSTGRKWWVSAIQNVSPYTYLFKATCSTVFALQVQ